MCGIVGFTGKRAALPLLLSGLSALEYRGYDSAGVALAAERLITVKSAGRLSCLQQKLKGGVWGQTCGIGHTRWATHGAPVDHNAHPHATPRLAMVHNGIIENYAELTAALCEQGCVFRSETDTESAAWLLDGIYGENHDPVQAIFKTIKQLRGSFAFGVIFADRPGEIYAVRRDSPLIVAQAEEGSFLASDVPALLAHTKAYYRPDEGVVCRLSAQGVCFFNDEGKEVAQRLETVDWSVEQARKDGFEHFMIKEIYEEPQALQRTVQHYLEKGLPRFQNPMLDGDALASFKRVILVARGTAMHAGLVGAYRIEKMARVPARVEIASEFRYADPVLGTGDLMILLSQSGETADTLAALRHAKAQGVPTLAIVNVVGSSVAREADHVLYTPAGPEIAVASTKAYSVQCAVLELIAIRMAMAKGRMDAHRARALCVQLADHVPAEVLATLELSDRIRTLAVALTDAQHLFYIGRDLDCALCTEGSLKLKEISYIHSEAYAAGELKHGTISLIERDTPVVALMTVPHVAEKMISAIREVRSRGARVILFITRDLAERYEIPFDDCVQLPVSSTGQTVFGAATALQLLAYHVAAARGLDVDKPRNLAKSVTVE